MADNQTFRSW
ncbi:BnaCnng74590D [Brassica napus]|uniref:BnaCnng74590D protein n=1 Tax=Brassica napus TaxID=3708 RepID=A0A078JW31_BRANA|nr:BnaCnng74590D [Brassica napus]